MTTFRMLKKGKAEWSHQKNEAGLLKVDIEAKKAENDKKDMDTLGDYSKSVSPPFYYNSQTSAYRGFYYVNYRYFPDFFTAKKSMIKYHGFS